MSVKSDYSDIEVPPIAIHRLAFMKFQEYGDKMAITDAATDQCHTFSQLMDVVQRAASGLAKLGVRKGDVVALFSYNTSEWVVMCWAVFCSGAIVTTVNPGYTKYELSHHLKDSGASYVYTIKDLLSTTKEAVKEVPKIKAVITSRSIDPSCVRLENLVKDDGSEWSKLEDMEFDINDVLTILYSSGTTGLPKGVLLTHKNVLANLMQYGHPDMVDPVLVEQNAAGKIKKLLLVLPLYHAYGLIGMNLLSLIGGTELVLLPKFDPHAFLGAIEKYKINRLPLVPSLVLFLARSPLVKQYDLSSIESAGSGAAPLSKDIEVELKNQLNLVDMAQGFGMTETTLIACTYGYNVPRRPGSCGKLLPSTEAKIVDISTRKTLGANERGELYLRGPQIMQGYLNRPEETRNTLDNEKWLHTGDIGYFDQDGYLFVVDRIKELIKVKGLQVAPAELEALLLQHPKVHDVGVVGIPDERSGELPRAFVVKKERVTEKELFDFVAERTASFKHLHGGIQFVSEIPRLPSGKIIRRKLKEMVTKNKL